CEFRRSQTVGLDLLGMLATIELDRELAPRTGEVDDSLSNWMLAAELPKRQLVAQRIPQDAFDVGGVPAQAACNSGPRSNLAQRPTSPYPLRPSGVERETYGSSPNRMRRGGSRFALPPYLLP